MNFNIPGDTGQWQQAENGMDGQHYTNGVNDASVLGGKLYVFSPNFNYQAFSAANPQIAPATAQETNNAINADAPGNGAGKGSMKEGILSALAAAASFYGAGQAISGIGGVLPNAAPSISSPAASVADASWGVNPATGSVLNSGATTWGAGVPDAAAGSAGGEAGLLGTGVTGSQALTGAGAVAGLGGGGFGADSGGNLSTGLPMPNQNYTLSGDTGYNIGGSVLDGAAPAADGGFGSNIVSSLPSAAASAATQTAIQRILAGNGTTADYASVLGSAAPGLIGAYASSQQTQAYKDLANQLASYGAPYRQRLQDIYADPSSFLKSPEVQVPVQQGSDILARSLSVQGNPTGSGNALQQLQSYSADQLFGRLGQEKDRLAGFGGLSNYNAAAPSAASAVIGSNANTANSLGAAANNVFNPPQTLAQQLAAFKTLSSAS